MSVFTYKYTLLRDDYEFLTLPNNNNKKNKVKVRFDIILVKYLFAFNEYY